VVAAAPATLEPPTRLVNVSSDRMGVIEKILVKPGEMVAAGQVLVQLDDDDSKATVELRIMELASADAALTDLKAWVRGERRDEAMAQAAAAQARLVRAEFEYERVKRMQNTVAASAAEYQAALETLEVAKAEVRRTGALVKLADAGPTVTEVKRAEARVAETTAQLKLARVALERRSIRSPLTGRVIYVHMEPGEVVLNVQAVQPILSLAAAGSPRLRAEVDEVDIGHVHLGQPVVATSESFPDRRFKGRVIYMEMLMGRRNIRTNRPRERQDTRVREVLVELDQTAADLPVDLMMTVRFLNDDIPAATQPGASATTQPAPTPAPGEVGKDSAL
jgi:HlyD family secretion protein